MCDCECFAVYCSSSALHYLPVIRWCCEIYVPVNMWVCCCVLLVCWCVVGVLMCCWCVGVSTQSAVVCCWCVVWRLTGHDVAAERRRRSLVSRDTPWSPPGLASNSNNNSSYNTVVCGWLLITVVCSPLNKHSAVTVLVSLNISKYHSHSQSPVFSCLLGDL